ncbi:MAG: purine-nucleoside phosphorylase [Gemmatales bacterium]|nr:purine-nucleoside phosphorylase [Gemmatales bacterium]MDW7995843.1 purine-nucleoside phosphorylase [Gemmatales bacterium]
MKGLYEQIQEAAAAIRQQWSGKPRFGIILGTGLGGLREEVQAEVVIPYESIPHFPKATAISHAGNLVGGTWQGRTVVLMEGRVHYYEGYPMQQITFPVRVMKALGCEILILTTACGGMNPQWRKGDLMLIEDHINLMGDNPLIGPNDERLGPRFPDMCYAYDRDLLALAERIGLEEQIRLHRGVYVALAGPNLETRAEYRFLRLIGADVVGMSTVPEVIVAVHAGLRVLGIAVITDMCLPDALQPVSVADILATAAQAEKPLRTLIRRVVAEA